MTTTKTRPILAMIARFNEDDMSKLHIAAHTSPFERCDCGHRSAEHHHFVVTLTIFIGGCKACSACECFSVSMEERHIKAERILWAAIETQHKEMALNTLKLHAVIPAWLARALEDAGVDPMSCATVVTILEDES